MDRLPRLASTRIMFPCTFLVCGSWAAEVSTPISAERSVYLRSDGLDSPHGGADAMVGMTKTGNLVPFLTAAWVF